MKIRVTQKHIDEGEHGALHGSCPVGLALAEKFPNARILVTDDEITINRHFYKPGEPFRMAMMLEKTVGGMVPFDFNIKVTRYDCFVVSCRRLCNVLYRLFFRYRGKSGM